MVRARVLDIFHSWKQVIYLGSTDFALEWRT